MYLPVELGRYVLKSGWVTACIWNGVHLKRGCENLTSVVRDESIGSFLHWRK